MSWSNVGTSLLRFWEQRESYQTPFYLLGLLLLASGVFHGVVMIVTGGPLTGALSWRKPATFGFSFGLTLITLTWLFTFFAKRRVAGWLLAVATPAGPQSQAA